MLFFKPKAHSLTAARHSALKLLSYLYPQVAQTLDLDKYDGVCTVSGDGLVAEVINGLANHSDWRRAIRMPFGAIPSGSGNGLARSVEAYTLQMATLAAIRGAYIAVPVGGGLGRSRRRVLITQVSRLCVHL